MSNYKVNARQLTPNTRIYLQGVVDYSRILNPEGSTEKALADENKRRIERQLSPMKGAFTKIVLSSTTIVQADPNKMSIEEQFVDERRYSSKNNPAAGLYYSRETLGTKVPKFTQLLPDKTEVEFTPEGDLAAGSNILLVLRTFKPADWPNIGLVIDRIVVLDPEVRYFVKKDNSNILAERGFTGLAPLKPLPELDAEEETTPEPAADTYRAAPAPTQAPQAAPVAEPQSDIDAQIAALLAKKAAQEQLAAQPAAAEQSAWANSGISYAEPSF